MYICITLKCCVVAPLHLQSASLLIAVSAATVMLPVCLGSITYMTRKIFRPLSNAANAYDGGLMRNLASWPLHMFLLKGKEDGLCQFRL